MTVSREHIAPPEGNEYAPFYAGYVALAREHDPMELLARQPSTLRAACHNMTVSEALARYAPGKWSVKQVLGHLTDVERIFSYRLFRISRGDSTPLSGFDEKMYAEAGAFDERSLPALLDEFESTRTAMLRLLEGISPVSWTRRGVANGVPISVRALLFITAGHVEHHIGILRDRYGVTIPRHGMPTV